MAPRLTAFTIMRIEDALRDAGDAADTAFCRRLADDYDTTLRTILHHKRRINIGHAPGGRSGGPRKVITWPMERAIKLLLDERPWFDQDEIADFLQEIFHIRVTQSTISRVLKRIMLTRKEFKASAAQQNDELRIEWVWELQQFTASQLVFVDESGGDGRIGDRQFGWSEEGSRAVVKRWLANRECISALPAYTTEGYIAAVTFSGSATRELFEE
jgi:transposase